MKLTMIGTGYVGLVTGTCFAELGHDVTCVDIDAAKVERMQRGGVPIYEPGLEKLFAKNLHDGRLTFTTDLAEGVAKAEVIFLCLPTPPGEDGSADLSYVLGVAEQLGSLLTDYVVIVDKSTVPVGTADKVSALIKQTTKAPFDVVSNPEFLREGKAIDDFMNPDRIVVGTSSGQAKKIMGELYEPLTRRGGPLFFMDEKSAEMTKYAANAFLAMKISFMNEIANLSERLGANVDNIRLGIGADERIGDRFLLPGPGFGGSCFPKDAIALERTAARAGYDFKLMTAVKKINDHQKHLMAEKVKAYFQNDLAGKTIAMWGLAFKADTDDVREAPAITTIDELLKAGAKIRATDPQAIENTRKMFSDQPDVEFVTDQYEVLKGADALVVMTEWGEYRKAIFEPMKQNMKAPVIFDGRNLYDPEIMRQHGFYYNSLGREVVAVPTS